MTEVQTQQEWIASLTAEDCERLIERALADRDFEGVVAALKILAVKDPARAEAVQASIELGLEVAKRRGNP